MSRLVNALPLFMALAWTASAQDTVTEFPDITPSTNITWTPCFDGFDCTRLEVPLDYGDPSLGTSSIAFVRLIGKNATDESPSIMFFPGGPGESGINVVVSFRDVWGTNFGEEYNMISFDPRGIGHSKEPFRVDCFSGNTEAREAWRRVHNNGLTNVSSTSLAEQYYTASIYGDWCNHAVETETPFGYHVTTAAVVQDLHAFMLANAEALGQDPADAKLWGFGNSHGTITGATFAAMYPDRVGRMLLDGVLDAEQYYSNDWRDNMDALDAGMEEFISLCHSAGADECSFWGPSVEDITTRLNAIMVNLLDNPIPISNAGSETSLPTLVTIADLKAYIFPSLYTPLASFPLMADMLDQLEQGNASALANEFYGEPSTDLDIRLAIRCADSYRDNKLSTIQDYKEYTELAVEKSKYLGDYWPISLNNILCRSMRPELSDEMVVKVPIEAIDTPTANPILWVSNTIDPITTLTSARKMHSRFANSGLIVQDAVGHTAGSATVGPTDCSIRFTQAYLADGTVPDGEVVCERQYVPFIDPPLFG